MPVQEVVIDKETRDSFFSKPPAWIIRYGISLMGVIFLFFILLAWWIRYPDTIEQNITLTAYEKPQRLVAGQTGEYILVVKNEEAVEKGRLLGYYIYAVSYENIETCLKKTENYLSDTLSLPDYRLLDIQTSYEAFRTQYQNYKLYKNMGVYLQIKGIEEQISSQKKVVANLRKQLEISYKEFEITSKQYERDKDLAEKKVISMVDFERTGQAFLSGRKSIQSLESSLLNAELQITQYQSKILELKAADSEKEQKMQADLRSASEKLKSDLETYKNKNYLVASQKGVVNYLAGWSKKAYLQAGQEILAILSQEKNIAGSIEIDASGLGKVAKGQKVQIKLLNYPYEEYGMLLGKVENISFVSKTEKNSAQGQGQGQGSSNKYRVDITLDNLMSDQKKLIPFQGELEGTARVITKEYSILERIFLKVLKATSV